MGIADRKVREKEELTQQILAAAKSLFIEKGFEKTSIRNIADRIEYSPGIIYHYFKDKNEIFHTLHTEGFQEMGKRMGILAAVENPMERLKAMGRIYIEFALENSDMYDLMFIIEAPMHHLEDKDDDCWTEGSGTFKNLKHTVKQCLDKGYFEGHNLDALSFMIWSTVHGMVSLKIRKRTDVIELAEEEQIVEKGFESFLKVLDKL
ncbi:TetR/AcrR family transcriptional regulator [Pararhodonellum marinum]|uniref:TetR/AcrR family transcriptional regulator n=1 Tax=Pararhodonellum marinum TaxID=2755358 RepID=UPI00188ECA8C|nr:TetR/AcrR family transcriptional regulator [Pararhodonellum marinum]